MFERCLRFRLDTPLGRVTTIAVGLVLLLPTATPVSAQFTKLLECNSDVTIVLGTQMANTVPVTLIVENGPSNDDTLPNGIPVSQAFDMITFWPSCDTTLPCNILMGPPQPVVFVGPVMNSCAEGVTKVPKSPARRAGT